MACGPFGKYGGWIVWDKPFGLNLFWVCKRHDARYLNPKGKTKEEIDYLFYEEGVEEANKAPWYLRHFYRKIAWVYYQGVSKTIGGRLAWELCRLRDDIAVMRKKD